jgi:hypothetical protein
MATRWRRDALAAILLMVAIAIGLTYKALVPTTIFTCTTFFDFEKQDKWLAFCKAMDSIKEKHSPETLAKIQKWLIVNEYSPNPKTNWTDVIKAKYPFVDFVQKGPEDKGQAASMNIILQKIRGYTYWIHWEETWYCRAPCLDRMFAIIQTAPITQVQVTQHKEKPNWLDSTTHPRRLEQTPCGVKYYRIYPAEGTEDALQKSPYDYDVSYLPTWPLYSLLPSINRVKDYHFGDFNTDPALWPFKFEWDFGRRWVKAGCTKAVLPDGPVVRDTKNHVSSYG